ncbi:aldehyde ferredoxin oxidoreductase family protein [Desulfobacula sp.]|uniref:aldehyde ferredoxin oxidoreductase family protein n=1 Tax=Desulfobacula sp. TaxID=2593537 RepID=UPI002614068B|nr:aldehyde ferredoxin oxidoreductase family protein [Desulfobacula sp.]
MYKGGYTGKVLRINLTDQSVKEEDLPFQMAKDFIGGAGFGIKYLFDEVPANTDALGPDNKLIFSPGPFSGTTVPCASRMAVTAKSPLTGAVGMGLSGGHFPVELKFAGYDVMIIEGQSPEPVYIFIKNGDVKFRSAKKLWGMKTTDTQQIIKNDLKDQNVRIACIGPAGENQIKIAAIINEWRAVGRKGLGAVMGSKNLKAIAVRGSDKIQIADKDKLKQAKKVFTTAMNDSEVLYPAFAKLGTGMVVDHTCHMGIFPTKNYTTTGEYDPIEKIGVAVQTDRTVTREHCYGCPVGCSQVKLAKTGDYAGTLSEGPEFETMYSFGGVTGVENIDAIIAADRLADEMGFDTMSSGVSIAFAMELYEKGILTKEDTGGIELNFGNDKAMMTILKQMSYREGLGGLLADGSKIAAQKIGKGSEKYAMHVKGLELPAYDVRGAKAHGLNYATSFTGADHCRGYAFQEVFGIPIPKEVDRFAAKGKGELTKWNQDIRTAVTDAPTMCGFIFDMAVIGIAAQNTADLMEAVTGIAYTTDDVLLVGERINNLARAFNVREGFTRADDTLPERLLTEPIPGGASKGHFISKEELKLMLDEYYTARGWNLETGSPSREKLTALNLAYAADVLNL